MKGGRRLFNYLERLQAEAPLATLCASGYSSLEQERYNGRETVKTRVKHDRYTWEVSAGGVKWWSETMQDSKHALTNIHCMGYVKQPYVKCDRGC